MCCIAEACCCCAGALCCSCLCAPCKHSGVHEKNYSKIGWVFFQLAWVLIAIILMYTLKDAVDWTSNVGIQCPEESGSGSDCLGPSLVIRTSWSLAVFQFFVFLLTLSRSSAIAAFHDGCWCIKFLIVGGILTASLWIPNDFFEGYMKFAKWVSFFFLLYQALLMLIVAYKINDLLVGNWQRDPSSCSKWILIFVTLTFTVCTGVWMGYSFSWFNDCTGQTWNMGLTLAISMLFYILVPLGKTRPDASILTSSIVWSYVTYMQWSALASFPNEICNPFLDSAGNTTAQIIMGLFFTIVCLAAIAGSTKKADTANIAQSANVALLEEEGPADKIEDAEKVTKAEETHVFKITTATILFQLLLTLSAIYYAMLLTNWGDPSIMDETSINYFENPSSAYTLKLIAEWFSVSVYTFSLLAPLCFPNRDFS